MQINKKINFYLKRFFVVSTCLLFVSVIGYKTVFAEYTIDSNNFTQITDPLKQVNPPPTLTGGTDDLPSSDGKLYYVSDTKTTVIYEKHRDPKDPNNADNDTVYQIRSADGKVYGVKSGFQILKDTVHDKQGVDALSGPGSYESVMKADSSAATVQQQQQAIDGTTEQINQLQNKLDNDLVKDDTERAAVQSQIDDLKGVKKTQEAVQDTKLKNQADNAPPSSNQQAEPISCISYTNHAVIGSVPSGIDIKGCIAIVGNTVLQIAAFVLWAAAKVFDFSMDYGLNFKDLLDKSQLVTVGWTIFRDLANIAFIFVLLFIAINTIIGTNTFGAKSMLAKVLVTAVMINFSLFFTKAIVDVSNIMALQFYGKMRGDGGSSGAQALKSRDLGNGVAAAFMNGLKLQSVFSSSGNGGGTETSKQLALNATNMITVSFGGSILILITAFVFLAGAILFIIRTGILMILMILSPLAFAAAAIPNASGYAKKWWSTLFSQALFAPIYMALIYVVVAVVSGSYGNKFAVGDSNSAKTFADMFNGGQNSISVLFQFLLIIFFMCASLVIASQLGAYGAKGAVNTGKGIRDWGTGKIARGTIGRTGNYLANSGLLRAYAGSSFGRLVGGGVIGEGLLKGGDRLSKLKIGDKSYADKRKQVTDERNNTAKLIENRTITRHFNESDKDYDKRVFDKKAIDKVRADRSVGVINYKDKNGNNQKKTSWLNLSRLSRDGQQAAILPRIKSKQTKSNVAAKNLETILGKKPENQKDWDVESAKEGSSLHKLQTVIGTEEQKLRDNSDPVEEKIINSRIAALRERENKLIERAERHIDETKIEMDDLGSKLDKLNDKK